MNSVKESRTVKKKLFHNFAYDFVRITGVLFALLWIRPKVHRPFATKTPKGAVLFSANHVSMADPLIMHIVFWRRRMYSLATNNLFRNKPLATFFRLMHCISVNKENFGFSSFREVTDYLSDGKAVLIFPEGQINREDDILSFKLGIVLMAYKSKASILPTYIVPHKKWYHRQHVVVGRLVDVSEMLGDTPSMDDFQKVSEELRKQEIELREYYVNLRG